MRTYLFFSLFAVCSIASIKQDAFGQTSDFRAPSRPEVQQANDYRVEIANLRADIRILDRRINELTLAMEDLINQNRQLAAQVEQARSQAARAGGGVQQGQLDRAIANLQQQIQNVSSEQRREILREVTAQIEALGSQTQAAIDALARNVSSRPTSTPAVSTQAPPSFSDDFPKEGVSYTVKSGDTLTGIATRLNSTVRDIQNANRIANPSSIQIGQTLFIPQRSN